MTFNSNSTVFIPDGRDITEAFETTRYLGIGAHQDDLEILAFHGISKGYDEPAPSFGGIVCTDGAGSPRKGKYAGFSNEEMKKIRVEEQQLASSKGKYSFVSQLGYSSGKINTSAHVELTDEIYSSIREISPDVIYTHSPADRHKTHVSVSLAVIEATRRMSVNSRPVLYGCEVWGSLDWLPEEYRIALDVSREDQLADELLKVFDSQIEGGKRYDLATSGRRRANATYNESHETDTATDMIIAMDLNPLISNPYISVNTYVDECIELFADSVRKNLHKRL